MAHLPANLCVVLAVPNEEVAGLDPHSGQRVYRARFSDFKSEKFGQARCYGGRRQPSANVCVVRVFGILRRQRKSPDSGKNVSESA